MNDAAVGSQAPRRGLVDTPMFVLRWLKRRLLRRFKLAIPVVAVAATVGAIASLAIPQRVNPPLAEPIGDRSLLPAPAGDAVESVTTTGVVQPTLLVQVGSQLSGDIVEVLVDFNDTVAKGQSLARLDPESFEAAVREADAALAVARAGEQLRRQAIGQFRARIDAAQAELAVAQAQLVRAQAERNGKVVDLKRTEPLAQRGTMPQKDLDDAKTAVAMSAANVKEAEATVQARQAAVQSADAELKMARVDLVMAQAASDKQQAALDVAQADLERTIIRAPIDGVVVGRSVNVGQTVVASLDSPTLFTVAEDIRRMEVHANVDEADIGQIRNGQSATFSVDSYPERSFQGTVRQIRKAPTVIQNVVTYTVVIATDNADLTLMPGMTALVRIVTGDGASGQQLSQS